MTRARDWLSISRHERVTKQTRRSEPVLRELADLEVDAGRRSACRRSSRPTRRRCDPLTITFSELAAFLDCGLAFRLRDLIGFQPRLAPELGYGKAIHHVMRTVAEATTATRAACPRPRRSTRSSTRASSCPTANKPAHRHLKAAARRLSRPTPHEARGRPASGLGDRAPVRAAPRRGHGQRSRRRDPRRGGRRTDGPRDRRLQDLDTRRRPDHALQLQVYADAGRREGLDVRGAYVHDLKAASRDPIGVDQAAICRGGGNVTDAAARIRARDYQPNPGVACRAARCGRSARREALSARKSDVEDLHDLVAVVVDHLDGDLAGLGPGERAATRSCRASPRRPRRCRP